ncbi:MAG: energy transducer TonB [Sphingomicrobium sp.]
MLRFISIAAALALPIHPAAADMTPLQPSGKWTMDYTPTSCEAKRRFGDIAVAIIPGALGESTRVMLELPGKAVRAKQFPAVVDPGDGSGAAKATAIIFPLAKAGTRGIYSVLPNALVERMMTSGRIDIRVGNPKANISINSARADLALGPMGGLRKALATCMADLRTQWGMIDGKLPKPAIATYSRGDVRGIFQSSDYPDDALSANQSGTAQYLLMIGRDGSVLDCVIAVSSGVASLDAMGCQVIRGRAKFKPAIDANGKPAVDTFLTPPISWRLG